MKEGNESKGLTRQGAGRVGLSEYYIILQACFFGVFDIIVIITILLHSWSYIKEKKPERGSNKSNSRQRVIQSVWNLYILPHLISSSETLFYIVTTNYTTKTNIIWTRQVERQVGRVQK
jgi:hypothetical protein